MRAVNFDTGTNRLIIKSLTSNTNVKSNIFSFYSFNNRKQLRHWKNHTLLTEAKNSFSFIF